MARKDITQRRKGAESGLEWVNLDNPLGSLRLCVLARKDLTQRRGGAKGGLEWANLDNPLEIFASWRLGEKRSHAEVRRRKGWLENGGLWVTDF